MSAETHSAKNRRLVIASIRRQRGVNLIEVMVSMVIGLFLVMGATTLYVSSKKSADVDDSIARLQETARYAMSILETDIRMANNWGAQKDTISVTNGPQQYTTAASLTNGTAANDCGTSYAVDVDNPIAATNNSYPTTFTATCAAHLNAVTTADTLTVRRASAVISPADGNKLQVCSTHVRTTIIKDGSEPCTGGEIHDLMANIYYVDQGSDQSSTIPSLRRHALGAGPAFPDVEVIPGVEDMQVQLGWASSTSASNAVEYLQPGTTLAGGQIVAVRVWLLVRAETADSTYRESRTFEYGDRATANGSTSTLNAASAANKAYAPADKFRRILVSRTFFIRNVLGT